MTSIFTSDEQNMFIRTGHQTVSPYVFSNTVQRLLEPSNDTVEIADPKTVATVYVPAASMSPIKGIKHGNVIPDLIKNYASKPDNETDYLDITIYDHRKNPDQPEYVMPGTKILPNRPEWINAIYPQHEWSKRVSEIAHTFYEPDYLSLHLVNAPETAIENIYDAYWAREEASITPDEKIRARDTIPSDILKQAERKKIFENLVVQQENKPEQPATTSSVRTLPVDLPTEIKDMVIHAIKDDPDYRFERFSHFPLEKKRAFYTFMMDEMSQNGLAKSYVGLPSTRLMESMEIPDPERFYESISDVWFDRFYQSLQENRGLQPDQEQHTSGLENRLP